jgi:hypothetical protein
MFEYKSCIPIVVVDRSSQRSKLCQSSRYGMPFVASITVHIMPPGTSPSAKLDNSLASPLAFFLWIKKNADETKDIGPCIV